MRHAKLLGIALLASMVTVGCGQVPTMDADVQGYGGYRKFDKKFDKKKNDSDVTQVNVIKDLNIGHTINQDQDIDQELFAFQENTSTQSENTAVNSTSSSEGGAVAVQASKQENEVEQEAEQEQKAVIVGDIKDIDIKQSNNIGKRDFGGKKDDHKKFDRKKRYWEDD